MITQLPKDLQSAPPRVQLAYIYAVNKAMLGGSSNPDEAGRAALIRILGVGASEDESDYAESKTKPASKRAPFSTSIRTDFTAIAKDSELIELAHKHDLAAAMDALVKHAVSYVEETGQDGIVLDEITKFSFPMSAVAQVRKVSKRVLKDGWDLGERHASREVTEAIKTRMSAEQFDTLLLTKRFAALRDKAGKYLDTKSFMMAGNLTDDAKSVVKNILVNAVKYSKGVDQVREEVYKTFAKKGMISPILAKAALGDALDVENPDYRLNTIIRTNTFDAINEARFDFFNDPDVAGYVEGLQYSAVMDGRTTDICAELDGHTHAADWEGWDTYRPPNHFNCRSVLVPILKGDEWEDSGWPSVDPQEGFK